MAKQITSDALEEQKSGVEKGQGQEQALPAPPSPAQIVEQQLRAAQGKLLGAAGQVKNLELALEEAQADMWRQEGRTEAYLEMQRIFQGQQQEQET